jgi:hypothetical protein
MPHRAHRDDPMSSRGTSKTYASAPISTPETREVTRVLAAKHVLSDHGAVDRNRALSGRDANILVLIFSPALGGFAAEMKSTSRLTYCGEFACQL